MNYIRLFTEVGLADVALVGGKNASLGELTQSLMPGGIKVPRGFVITAEAYTDLIEQGGIRDKLVNVLKNACKDDLDGLRRLATDARELVKSAGLPAELCTQIKAAYLQLVAECGGRFDVAVRSSATAEDLPEASFAGQQESFLNISGDSALLEACLNCFASLFTERAIAYRIDHGFDHMSVKLSIAVQQMIRSDLASAGVIFTLDPESGFKDVILVTSSFGLGESVVSGRVDPDEFVVFKPTLKTHPRPIIRIKCGAKQTRMVYSGHGSRTTQTIPVPENLASQLSLSDPDVLKLANYAVLIEDHYSARYGHPSPMDIEWAKDGLTGELYIVQARPETVQSQKSQDLLVQYTLEDSGTCLLEGRSIGDKIGSGKVRLIATPDQMSVFADGDVLVAEMTDPDWEPVMKRASAIVTNRGGRTCHAAIVSRELGIPCVVGTQDATSILKDDQLVTVSCAQGATGRVYEGKLKFTCEQIAVNEFPKTRTKVMVNVGNPDHAFAISRLPVAGVGLAREEFIIAREVKVHPLALVHFDRIKDPVVKKQIETMTSGYHSKQNYFVRKLAEGISTIAAAFYPREVIVRLSDFKTNEYANLIGGKDFEPQEENPMLGFRGASRYYSDSYRAGFAMECQALKAVREEAGLTNVKIMVPFCRTVEEAKKVIAEMKLNGLAQHENGLEFYMMCELPSNVICIDSFAELFDGFSIGSNDLTQLVLGVDRDSSILSGLFDERNPAVLSAIEQAILGAHRHGKKIGICGQAPSDYPEFVQFLIKNGIDSISLSEDAVIKVLTAVARAESAPAKLPALT